MKILTIVESEMEFGPYEENNIFHIEKSKQYINTLKNNHVKTCEFILSADKKIIFVEAKKTVPQKYGQFISDVAQKMRDSLSLYGNILLGRYTDDGLPKTLSRTEFVKKNIVLLLIIKDAKEDWLSQISNDLSSHMYDTLRIWKINNFIVVNEELARQRKYIR